MEWKASSCVWLALALFSSLALGQDATFSSLPVLQPNIQPGSTFVTNDINGDGVSDLLWFNPTTSQFGYWLIGVDSNGNIVRKGLRTINVTPGYYVAATGDFNGDGKVDLIWTSANHDIYLWASTGSGFQSTYIDSYPSGWQLIGAGDIDGDGLPDLLWWNQATNQFAYWLMKNNERKGSGIFNVPSGYSPVAIGYFSQSNRLSILLASSSGDVYDWDSQVGGSFSSYYVGNIKNKDGTSWVIDGISYRSGGYIAIETVGATEYQYYSWNRQFDAQGNQTSATLYNGLFGGRSVDSHIGGFIFDMSFNQVNQNPLFVFTDVLHYINTPAPQPMVYVNGPYQQALETAGDSLAVGYPSGWYLIGAKSNQNL